MNIESIVNSESILTNVLNIEAEQDIKNKITLPDTHFLNSEDNNEDKHIELEIVEEGGEKDPVFVNKTSASRGIIPSIIGPIVDFFDGDTKDGKIGNTKQHSTGDCWLLSGINALSYTEKGREMIKNALEYHDGYTIVHLEGIGDYEVTDFEIAQTKGSSQYSSGDDDMIIFELAIEKVIDDVACGKFKLDTNLFDANTEEKTKKGKSSAEGGFSIEAIYYLTGKLGKMATKEEDRIAMLDEFQANNGKDYTLNASVNGENDGKVVKDVNGKNVKLVGPHAYAVKAVDGDTVTVINPWNSGKEIVLSREVFLDSFYRMEGCDLSDNNPEKDLKIYPETDEEGNKIFKLDKFRSDELENYHGDEKCTSKQIKYSSDGALLEERFYNEKNELIYYKTYNEKTGKLEGEAEYSQNREMYLYTFYDKKGRKSYDLVSDRDRSEYYNLGEEQMERLNRGKLLSYKNFDISQIMTLLNLEDERFEKALKILEENPDATINTIMAAV